MTVVMTLLRKRIEKREREKDRSQMQRKKMAWNKLGKRFRIISDDFWLWTIHDADL